MSPRCLTVISRNVTIPFDKAENGPKLGKIYPKSHGELEAKSGGPRSTGFDGPRFPGDSSSAAGAGHPHIAPNRSMAQGRAGME